MWQRVGAAFVFLGETGLLFGVTLLLLGNTLLLFGPLLFEAALGEQRTQQSLSASRCPRVPD